MGDDQACDPESVADLGDQAWICSEMIGSRPALGSS